MKPRHPYELDVEPEKGLDPRQVSHQFWELEQIRHERQVII